MRRVRAGAAGAVTLLLAAFFLFVGYHKAFAPLADLVRHGAWTVHLPRAAGILVGWSEMACALALLTGLLPRFRTLAAAASALLITNQIIAAGFHLAQGETTALPQNLILIALLVLLCAARWRAPFPPAHLKETPP